MLLATTPEEYTKKQHELTWRQRNLSTKEMKAYAATSVALLAITAIVFVTLALLQHYNVIHINENFGKVLAESGKSIMVALNTIKHGVMHDRTTQLILAGIGGIGLGFAGKSLYMKAKNPRRRRFQGFERV